MIEKLAFGYVRTYDMSRCMCVLYIEKFEVIFSFVGWLRRMLWDAREEHIQRGKNIEFLIYDVVPIRTIVEWKKKTENNNNGEIDEDREHEVCAWER